MIRQRMLCKAKTIIARGTDNKLYMHNPFDGKWYLVTNYNKEVIRVVNSLANKHNI